MKYYLIISSIILVMLIGSLFLFIGKTIELDSIDFSIGETEKAIATLEYKFEFPTYIPENMIMKDASISVVEGKHQMIGFSYLNTINSFRFEFYASKSEDSLDDIAQNDDYWSWKKTKIGGKDAFIGVNNTTKETNLIFRIEDILYRFYTNNMKTQELVKIANSLK